MNKIQGAIRAEHVADSIAQVKAEQQRKAKELLAKKTSEDSLKKVARSLFVQDSLVKAKEVLAQKHEQDSIKKHCQQKEQNECWIQLRR